MAKTLYAHQVNPATSHRGNNDPKYVGTASWWAPWMLGEARDTETIPSALDAALVTSNTTGIEVSFSGGIPLEWVSEPLSADFTIAGTITANIWAKETSMSDNASVNIGIDKVDGATGVITQIVKTNRTANELGTSPAVNNFTATPVAAAIVEACQVGAPTAAVPLANSANLYVQSFVASDPSTVDQVVLYLGKFGAPTDNYAVAIQADSAGVPSGTDLTSGTFAASTVVTAGADLAVALTPYALTPGLTYWIVVKRVTGVDGTNYVNVFRYATDVYAGGVSMQFASGAWGAVQNDVRFGVRHTAANVCKRGDRLRLRIFAGPGGGTLTAPGPMSAYVGYQSAGTTGDTYITFTEDLTFEPAGDPTGPTLESSGTTSQSTLLGNTSNSMFVEQGFLAQAPTLRYLDVWMSKPQGSPTDNLILEIQTDSGGIPSGTVVATADVVAGSSLFVGGTYIRFAKSGAALATLTPGVLYHAVITRSDVFNATNYYGVGRNTAGSSGPEFPNAGTKASGVWVAGASYNHRIKTTYDPSTYYLTDTAETINPGAAIEKKALTTRGGSTAFSTTNTVVGPTPGVQITNTTGGSPLEWYTPPLEAVTLGGKAKFNVWAYTTNALTNASPRCEIAVVEEDGSGAVVWGSTGVEAITTYGSAGEIDTSIAHAHVAWVAGDNVSVTAGQRLRFRVYWDDCANAPQAVGLALLTYNGATAAATGDSYVILPVAVTEQATGPQTRFGAATVSLTDVRTSAGFKKTFAAATVPLTVSRTSAGFRKSLGAATVALVDAVTTSGIVRKLGAASVAIINVRVTNGIRKTFVSALVALANTRVTLGRFTGKTGGTVSLVDTVTSNGVQSTSAVTYTGSATVSLTNTRVTNATRKTLGAATVPLVNSRVTNATRKTLSAATVALVNTRVTGATRKAFAAATVSLIDAVTTGATRKAFAAALVALTNLRTTTARYTARSGAAVAEVVNVTTSGVKDTPGFDPTDLTGLGIWLDASQLGLADGAEITTWPNLANPSLAGTQLNVAPYRPALRTNGLNGKPVARFVRNSGLRWTGTGIDLNWTVIYVGHLWGTAVATGDGRIVTSQYPPSNLLIGFWSQYQDVAFVEAFLSPDAKVPKTEDWKLYSATGEGVPGDAKAWLYSDGAFLSGNHAVNGGWQGFFNLNGYSPAGVEETCDCEVAEVVMYDRRLSDVERAQVEDYLRAKWMPGVTHVGSSTVSLTDAVSTNGTRKTLGAATVALVNTRVTAATRKALGSATVALTNTRVTGALRKALGAATVALVNTRVSNATRKTMAVSVVALTNTRVTASRVTMKALSLVALVDSVATGSVRKAVSSSFVALTNLRTTASRILARSATSTSETVNVSTNGLISGTTVTHFGSSTVALVDVRVTSATRKTFSASAVPLVNTRVTASRVTYKTSSSVPLVVSRTTNSSRRANASSTVSLINTRVTAARITTKGNAGVRAEVVTLTTNGNAVNKTTYYGLSVTSLTVGVSSNGSTAVAGIIVLNDADAVYLGSVAASAVYVGSVKVWSPRLDPSTSAYLAATGLDPSYAPTLDALVVGLKSHGLWTKMKAIYPMIGGTAALHKWNLKDPRDLDAAYRLSFTGPFPDHTVGYRPNPAPDYSLGWADTHLIPAGTLDPLSVHMSLYSLTTLGAAPRCDMGNYNWGGGGGRFHLIIHYTSGEFYYSLGHNGVPNVAGGDGHGLFVSSRTSVNSETAYKDGVTLGGNGATPNALPPASVLIGSLNGYNTRECSDTRFGFASIGDGLSAAEVSDLNTVVQAYQAALGR